VIAELGQHCAILVPAFLALVGLTACGVPFLSSVGAIPPSFMLQARQAAQNVRDACLRVEVEWNTPVLADKQTLELWYSRPDKIRLEIVESGQVGFRDIIFAENGDQAWMYRHAARQVDVGPAGSVKPAVVYEVVQSLADLFFGQSFEEVTAISRDYASNRWAFKVTGRAGPGVQQSDRNRGAPDCTVWLEDGSLLPFKVRCQEEGAMDYTATVQEAQYNTGLTDDLFDIGFLPTQSYAIHRIN